MGRNSLQFFVPLWDDAPPQRTAAGGLLAAIDIGEHGVVGKGDPVKKRLLVGFGAAVLSLALVGSASAASGTRTLPRGRTGVKGLPQHANVHLAPAKQYPTTHGSASTPFAPSIGTSWDGISDSSVSPPDPNGAIGPSSYIEIINLQIAIYQRTGTLITTKNLQTLTGHNQFILSDPMVLWDADTQR